MKTFSNLILLLVVTFSLAAPLNASGTDAKPGHRFGLISVAYAPRPSGDYSLGMEFFTYEFVFRSGLGIKLAPINAYRWKSSEVRTYSPTDPVNYFDSNSETTNYVPFWLRYRFRTHRIGSPFAGVGVGYHEYEYDPSSDSIYKREHSLLAAGEVGVEFGKGTVVHNVFSVKIFPGTLGHDDPTLAFVEYGLTFGR